ncbi:unnamed protein product [Ostreobium quekettii]|uniref:Uncharacterized protein n=1 Tax=Ostreobium quekettii TaxID=121088 RepID=A0A8S1ILH3_9CHLO|nr:unnamed protein product [Ostreobium quekettii]
MGRPNREPLLEDAGPRVVLHRDLGDIQPGVDLAATVPYMESRKSIRKYRGAYRPTRPLMTWTLYTCLLLLWGFGTLDYSNKMLTVEFKWNFGASLIGEIPVTGVVTTLMWALSLTLMFYFVRYQVKHRNMAALYITQAAIIAMVYVIVKNWQIGTILKGRESFQSAVLGLYLAIMFVIIIVRYHQVHYLPVWQEKGWPLTAPRLRPTGGQDIQPILLYDYVGKIKSPLHWCAYEYVGTISGLLPRSWVSQYKVIYVGEVDDKQRPHGFGEWWDSHYHGEHLCGLWHEGRPIGPFMSREKGSSSGFLSTRIGYFTHRGDGVEGRWFMPVFVPEGELLYGTASIECSVSGVFFKDYPRISFHGGPVSMGKDADIDGSRIFDWTGVPSPAANDGESPKFDPQDLGQIDGDVKGSPVSRGPGPNSRLSPRTMPGYATSLGSLVGAMERSASIKRDFGDFVRNDSIVVSVDPSRGLVISDYMFVGRDSGPPSVSDLDVRIVRRHSARRAGAVEHRGPPQQGMNKSVSSIHSDWQSTGLDVVGWQPKSISGHYEALLYIPGFNASVHDAVRILGQLMALGNFPTYIKPIVFSWPGGNYFSYLQARFGAAECDRTRDAFIQCLRSLAAHKFRTVHLMTHSCGLRVVTYALSTLEEIIPSPVGLSPPGTLPLKIATITLMNPDFELEDFRLEIGHRLRALCPVVTIYGDKTDGALLFAEIANTLIEFFLPKRVERVKKAMRLNGYVSDASDLEAGGGMGRGAEGEDEEKGRFGVSLPNLKKGSNHGEETLDGFQGIRYFYSVFHSALLSPRGRRKPWTHRLGGWVLRKVKKTKYPHSVGRSPMDITDPITQEPLDMDVIETTYIETNVHAWRHNYFNVNRELVEDLRDLLVTQRRAHQRTSRLEWLGGNVFGFLIAPSHIMNP